MFVQEVSGILLNPLSTLFALGSFLHQSELLGQVHNSNLYLWIIPYTLQCPATCITTYIQKLTYRVGKDNLQRLRKGVVRIIMVKGKPLLLCCCRERRKPLINSWPITKDLEPFRLAFSKSFLHMKKPLVTYLMNKLHINTYRIVLEQKPACLGH